MKPLIESPATIVDMADMAGRCHIAAWLAFKEMLRGGDTWSMRYRDHLLGVFGVYPSSFANEAWFCIRPAAAPHMLFLARQIRLTLDARKYPDLVAVCRTDEGKRIAALCGFRLREVIDDLEIWEWKSSSEAGEAAALRPRR